MTPAQARRLRQIAKDFQPQFQEMLRELASENGHSLAWLFSSLASRDRYRSLIFSRCCKLLLVTEALTEGENEIATNDHNLAKIIRRIIKQHKLTASVQPKTSCWDDLRRWFRAWAILGVQCRVLWARWRSRQPPDRQPERLVLLDLFVSPELLESDGTFIDRYYSGWESFVNAGVRQRVKYLPSLCGFPDEGEGLTQLRESCSQFVIPDDYLSGRDYLWIVWQTIKMHGLRTKDLTVGGVSIQELLRNECREKFSAWSGMLALLNYRFAYRSANVGVKVTRLIDWSENQTIDRGLVLGFHRFHSETRVAAYKGYPLSSLAHPHLAPTWDEIEKGVHPREIWTIGSDSNEAVKTGHPNEDIQAGPAFRFKKMFGPPIEKTEGNDLLVCLSVDYGECLEMLTTIKAATDDFPSDLKITIKTHPMLPREKLIGNKQVNHKRWRWSNGSISECMRSARIVCANVSSTAVEALTECALVVLIGRRGDITWPFVPKFLPDEYWALCFDCRELAAAVKRFTSHQHPNMHEMSQFVRSKCFTKPTRQNVLALLGENAPSSQKTICNEI